MITLRVIVVDDEPLAVNLLSAIIDDIEGVEVVTTCQNGREAVKAVLKHSPDVLFLDIQMPEMNGFDVIAAIQNDFMPLVIFSTAYAEYAVDAFKVQALDYVLKPLDDQAVINSLERARSAVKANLSRSAKSNLLATLHDISEKVDTKNADVTKPLIIKNADKISFLTKEKIEWLEAAGDYVCIHIDGSTRMVRSTLTAIESELNKDGFKRIHRSTIVNTSYITDIISAPKGEAYAIMKDGNRLKVSRRYGSEIRKLSF